MALGSSGDTIALAIEAEKRTAAVGEAVQEINGAASSVVAANNKVADAAVDASAKQVAAGNAVNDVIARNAAAVAAATSHQQKHNVAVGGIPVEHLKKASFEIRELAIASQEASLGGNAAVHAFANLATTIGMTSEAAGIAEIATGIGVAVVAATALYEVWHKLNEEAKAPESFLSRLQNYNRVATEAQLAALDARLPDLQAKAAAGPKVEKRGSGLTASLELTDPAKEYNEALKEREKLVEQLTKQTADYEHAERDRNRALTIAVEGELRARQHLVVLERLRADYAQQYWKNAEEQFDLARVQANQKEQDDLKAIAHQFTMSDETGRLIALNAEQIAQRQQLIDAAVKEHDVVIARINAEDEHARAVAAHDAAHRLAADFAAGDGGLGADYQEKLALIDELKQRRIADGESEIMAERERQMEIRKLRRDTMMATAGYLGEIANITEQSGSRTLKAIGHTADAMRRILIGADGAHSAVLAIKEGAAALASAGVGDFRGAALHAASSVQFAAAAAKAAQESLGGGGGGAAGSGGASTFEPNAQAGAGSFTLQLITRDPYGRDAIAETIYQLGQAGDQKRTVPIAPTTGLVPGRG